MKKRIVLIDPGHGAETPGKRSPDGSLREYEFNRDVARRLKALLEDLGFSVRLTVDDDRDLPLKKRTDLAEMLKAHGYDVFLLSIHANAGGDDTDQDGWTDAHGIETFTNNAAQKSAQIIQNHLVNETKLYNRGVKHANLHITRETGKVGIPAVLVELGFMTNIEECRLLKTSGYRQKCAVALAKALCQIYDVPYRFEQTESEEKPTYKSCKVKHNNKQLKLTGLLIHDRSFVPVRSLAAELGIPKVVDWCDDHHRIILNDRLLPSTVVLAGVGYAWSREVADALGLDVDWDAGSNTLILKGDVKTHAH